MGFFSGSVCIVTGGASGIGKALCTELVLRGAHVTVTDINSDLGKKTAGEIRQTNSNVEFMLLDVTDYDAFESVVGDTISKYGRIDYLFNNAGVAIFSEAQDYTCEDWHELINTDH